MNENVSHTIPILERYRNKIEEYIRSVLIDKEDIVYTILRYHFGLINQDGEILSSPKIPGKLLRPTLCLMTVDALGGDIQKAMPAAVAIEFIHNFSLIHDDIEDNDSVRHNKPAVWKIYGVGQAINAGDALSMLGFHTMASLSETGIEPSAVTKAMNVLIDATEAMTVGQERDMAFEEKDLVTVDEYLAMSRGKTQAIFTAAILIGAIICGVDDMTMENLKRFSEELGAFQIADDYLGIWGHESKTGKSNKSDILRRKKTYPIVFVLTHGSSDDIASLKQIFKKDVVEGKDVKQVKSILEKNKVKEHVSQLLMEYKDRSSSVIRAVNIPEWAKKDYKEIVDFIVSRTY